MRRSAVNAEPPALSPDARGRELWGFFLRHGYLCHPRRGISLGGDKGWEVRFVGVGAAGRRRLVWLLGQAGLPGARVTERRRALGVSVPGRRAVYEFRRLWRRFDPRVGRRRAGVGHAG
jgi:hypothetical protein